MLFYDGEFKKCKADKKKILPKEDSNNQSVPQVRGASKINITVLPLIFTFYFLEKMWKNPQNK